MCMVQELVYYFVIAVAVIHLAGELRFRSFSSLKMLKKSECVLLNYTIINV